MRWKKYITNMRKFKGYFIGLVQIWINGGMETDNSGYVSVIVSISFKIPTD